PPGSTPFPYTTLFRSRYLADLFGGRVKTIYSTKQAADTLVPDADLVIGAVLVAGAAAPKVVTAEHVRAMRPGSVLVDISIDQGGDRKSTRLNSSHVKI